GAAARAGPSPRNAGNAAPQPLDGPPPTCPLCARWYEEPVALPCAHVLCRVCAAALVAHAAALARGRAMETAERRASGVAKPPAAGGAGSGGGAGVAGGAGAAPVADAGAAPDDECIDAKGVVQVACPV